MKFNFLFTLVGATVNNAGASGGGDTSKNGATVVSSNVLIAAQTLAMSIQQSGNITPSPDPLTARIINTWLDTHLPVSQLNQI